MTLRDCKSNRIFLAVFAALLFLCNGDLLSEAKNFYKHGQSVSSLIGEWHQFGGLQAGCNGYIEEIIEIEQDHYAIGGSFTVCGNQSAHGLVFWDGGEWYTLEHQLGYGTIVRAITLHEGSLYVGGSFSSLSSIGANNIAKWNGEEWQLLGGLEDNGVSGTVWALASSPSGLYVGGRFDYAGGSVRRNLARWDNGIWDSVGGVTWASTIHPARVFDIEIEGSKVFIAGSFNQVAGVTANNIAVREDGSWSSLGASDAEGTSGRVYALSRSKDGLYAGGDFTIAGGEIANRIAKWDGASWSPVGVGQQNWFDDTVLTIDASEDLVFVGGRFTEAGTSDVDGVAVWNGEAWDGLGNPQEDPIFGEVRSILHSGSEELYIGGAFPSAGAKGLNNLARLDQLTWVPLAAEGQFGLGGYSGEGARSIVAYGSGFIAVGDFNFAGELKAPGAAYWDGDQWQHPWGEEAADFDGRIYATEVVDEMLYVGGEFETINALEVNGIAMWDGSTWHALGSEDSKGVDGSVRAIAEREGLIYVGGSFSYAGDALAENIAVWDGLSWDALGSQGPNGTNGTVHRITDAINGIYVAGLFDKAGETEANRIALWDGSSWGSLGEGWMNGVDGYISDIEVYDNSLYVAGALSRAGDLSVDGMAFWDGSEWLQFSCGTFDWDPLPVSTLANSRHGLVMAGNFFSEYDAPANGAVFWDGQSCSVFDDDYQSGGLIGAVSDILVLETQLTFIGNFASAGGITSMNIATFEFGEVFRDSFEKLGKQNQDIHYLPRLHNPAPAPDHGSPAFNFLSAARISLHQAPIPP